MNSKYILRLDDACHTMNLQNWEKIEDICDEFSIKPIVAVVPLNCDLDLIYQPYNPKFWDKVRTWKDKGWTIAMHGYQHAMHETKSKIILPFYKKSEFAGLSYDQQIVKIKCSLQIFIDENVEPTAWVAPAHCFDLITLQAIAAETSIRVISDGIARNQYYEHDFYWIPQQLWNFVEKKSGLWTICLHPNTMTDQQFETLRLNVKHKFSSKLINLNDIKLLKRPKSVADRFEEFIFWRVHWKNNLVRQVLKVIRD
jgi:predicted deacetylase